MVVLSQIRSSNARISDTVHPRPNPNVPSVAVFIGGTSGIGKVTLTILAGCKTPIRIYVIGRNGATQANFLSQLRQSNQAAEIIWLEGQVTLLAEVKRLCEEIKTCEKNIDLLFMSAAYLPFGGRVETAEALDKAMVLRYWSRILFIINLLPLMRAPQASESTYRPRVVSVLAAGYESSDIPLDDLGLSTPGNFSVSNMIATDATMTTLTLSRLAAESENKTITFIHHNPGPVKTDILKQGWARGSWAPTLLTLTKPFMALAMRNVEEAGERLLYIITSAQYGGSGLETKVGLTVNGTAKGDVFLVDKDQECMLQEKVIAQLRLKNATEIVRRKTEEVLTPYF